MGCRPTLPTLHVVATAREVTGRRRVRVSLLGGVDDGWRQSRAATVSRGGEGGVAVDGGVVVVVGNEARTGVPITTKQTWRLPHVRSWISVAILWANTDPKESLGAIVAHAYVIGKVLGDRRPHISQIRSQMVIIWYIKGDFRIIPKPNNIFLIGFELEEDKNKMLKGSPWCPKPKRKDEGVDKRDELSFGPWRKAKETYVKHYPAKKQLPVKIQDDVMIEEALNTHVPARGDEEGPIPPNSQTHTGPMNTVTELVTKLEDYVLIHASASKPSWTRLARSAKVKYQPTTVELMQLDQMEEERMKPPTSEGLCLRATDGAGIKPRKQTRSRLYTKLGDSQQRSWLKYGTTLDVDGNES
ncbi:hypothetical protein Tsubulata_001284 [Turnera subulata]|uniref:DUF4283 domain-containing protein n=1 Tax=Turnera subulata TaxID=218843 RepID=A0A9Q0FLE1_9ROSI|nr:hypothetical protein Tsubulata_001284 [Turnera subulata]